ncbi:MAG: hypothetical protein AAF252_03950 [Pseudomonadota bacterium]
MIDLDAQLLAAHAAKDTRALVHLYQKAAACAATEEARAFYLTHAHVFALEINHPDTAALRAQLVALGRESAL